MSSLRGRVFWGTAAFVLLVASLPLHVSAEAASDPQPQAAQDLQDQVTRKKNRVKELEGLIGTYRERINAQETKQTSLENEVSLLDNRIRENELAVEATQTEIEALTLEIQSLEEQIAQKSARIEKQKGLISELVRRIRQGDDVSPMDVLLSRPNLSAFFDRVEEVRRLQADLGKTLSSVKQLKENLQKTQKERDERRQDLVAQGRRLKQQQRQLEGERNFKLALLDETKNSQDEFQKMLYELRQQEQTTQDDVSALEEKLRTQLQRVDDSLARGDVLLNWPVVPGRGISAHFHDPSYPFKHLFQHPGTDIPTSVGTPIRAAAGGYVAWTRTGKSYGNYLMIIHPGGIATVYAHLSKFVAKPDSYVDRGDIIGLSGGRPGDQGAGLSTGPHLHFEVRQNGIPINAENFLPSLPGEE